MNVQHANRKNEHLSLAEKFYQSDHHIDQFDQIRLVPNALPEMSTNEVDLSTNVAGLDFQWPF